MSNSSNCNIWIIGSIHFQGKHSKLKKLKKILKNKHFDLPDVKLSTLNSNQNFVTWSTIQEGNFSNSQNKIYFKKEQKTFIVHQILWKLKKTTLNFKKSIPISLLNFCTKWRDLWGIFLYGKNIQTKTTPGKKRKPCDKYGKK